ncbi:hypothetical protein MMC29_000716 [Sticta canariensis]|nr:hypothetical protein [Sticta canariensis]
MALDHRAYCETFASLVRDTVKTVYKKATQKAKGQKKESKNGSILGQVPVTISSSIWYITTCQQTQMEDDTSSVHVKHSLIDPFVLEEDGDSGHGGGSKRNLVRIWKEKNELKSCFNCPSSPDLSSIENCWQAPKKRFERYLIGTMTA